MSINTPKTFYLAGSNDGISWSLIDNETLASSGSGSSLVSYSSSFNTQQSFLYFRLIIPNNFGGATVQVTDLQIFGQVSVQVIDSAGVTGQYGFTGLMSALGFTGWTGAVGFTGPSGVTGFTGASGRTGVTGPTGTFTGISGVSGITGLTGFTGLTGTLVGFTGATGPLNQSTLTVTTITGRTGVSGGTGFTGMTGWSGFSGMTGGSGFSGGSGATGFSGFSGVTGASGSSGSSGITGASGITGYSGDTGGTGFTGFSGQSGETGFSGVTGISGRTGGSGIIGFTALTSVTGVSGLTGTTGFRGETGWSGFTGTTGYTGWTGLTGLTGVMGVTGLTGCVPFNDYYPPSAMVIDPKLLYLYTFEPMDVSGSGANLYVKNQANGTYDLLITSGIINNTIDGSPIGGTISSSISLNATGYSVGCWFRAYTTANNQLFSFSSDATNNTTLNFYVALNNFYIRDTINASNINGSNNLIFSNVVINQLYHIVYVNRGTSWLVYLNGTLFATLTGKTPSNSAVKGFNFLGRGVTAVNYFNGMIDGLFVYNAQLSGEQITDIYSKGQVPSQSNYFYTIPIQYYYNDPRLVCLYTFEPMDVFGSNPNRRVKNQANGEYDLLLDTGIIIDGTETIPNTASIDSIRNTASSGNLRTSFNSATSFSIGSWFYYTTNTNTQTSGIFFGYNATSGHSRVYVFKIGSNLIVRIVGNDLSGGSNYYSDAYIPVNINSWNFFTWVATSTRWTVYMNGTTYISGVNMNFAYFNTSSPVFAVNATFQLNTIGSIDGGILNFKDGKIDNFFIYSAALSSSEVADIYSKGQVPNPTNYYYTIPIQYYQPKLFLSPTGRTGFSGMTGFTGPTGTRGVSGMTGTTGRTGLTGMSWGGGFGITGLTGPSGFRGRTGTNGFTGHTGRQYIDTGITFPAGSPVVTTTTVFNPLNTDAALVLYYPFDSNLLNYASGVGVTNGSIVGGTVSQQTSIFKFGTGSLFQSASNNTSYFSIPTIPTNTNGYTFSFWLYMTATTNGVVYSFANALNTDINRIFWWNTGTQFVLANNNVRFNIPLPSINVWTHYVWTLSKSNTSVVYINGTQSYSYALPYVAFAFIYNWILGDTFTGSNKYAVKGYVDEFRYYNRVLNQSEVTYLYNVNALPVTTSVTTASNIPIAVGSYFGPNLSLTGRTGLNSNTGFTGFTGIMYNGQAGINGITGITGGTGAQGSSGRTGITGISGSTGVIGFTGMTASAGGSGGSGSTGLSGVTGVIGVSGVTGVIGVTGISGVSGVTGRSGITGIVGPTGITGRTGSLGPTGVSGATGPNDIDYSGLSGNTGLGGLSGFTGWTGFTGPIGLTGSTGKTGNTGNTGFTGRTGAVGITGVSGIYGMTGNTGVYGGTGITGGTGYTGYVGEVGPFSWGTEYVPSTLDIQDNVIYTKPVYSKTLGAGWIRDGATVQARLVGGLPRVELVYGLNVGSDVGGDDILITLATDASGNSGVSRSLDGKQYTYPFNALTISGGVVPSNIFWDGLKWILTPSMSYSYDGIQFYTNANAYGIVSIAIGGRRLGSGNGEGKNLYIGIGSAGIYQSFDGFHWYFISGILTASVGGRVIWYGNGWMATGVEGIAQGSSDGLTWALVSSGTFGGTGGGLDVLWSGERWLAVGAATSRSGTVMSTSTNGGTSWSKVDISYALVASPVFGKGHEMSLEWNGQVFMLTLTSAVGIYPLWYSLDGLSWTVCSGPLNSSGLLSLERVRWNGSRFLAVGTYAETSGIVVRSLNGGTTYSQMPYTLMMTPTNSPALKDIFHIEYSSNRSIHSLRFPFSETLALGSRPLGGGVIGRSLDEGLTWTWIDISGILTDIHCGAWNGNRWLIGGHGGNNTNTLATGMDGSQWTACGSRYLDSGVYCIGWSTELHTWVAGGTSTNLSGGLMYCTSILGLYFIPALWTSSVIVTSVGGVVWNGVVWVATPLNSGTVFGYSMDGQTWTGVDLSGVVNTISTSAQWNGSYWWMGVVNKSGVSSLAKSFNAITWIVDGPFTDASGNQKVLDTIFASADIDIGLATTVSGDIWVSLGGYNDWAGVVATGGNGKIRGGNALSWNEAIFVVGDLSGQLWTSPNGFQWQYSRTFFDTSNSIINGIIWNQPRLGYAFLQTILVASGIRNGGGGALGYSYDGIQWFSCATGAGGLDIRINGIAYCGKTWVAVGTGIGGWIATSFNGRIWTGTMFGVQAGVESLMTEGYDITWNGTIFLAVGVDASGTGVMASSFDGYTWTRIFQSFGGAGSYVNSITWTGRTWVAYVYGGASTTFICNDVHAVDGWQATNPPNTYLMDASSVFLVYGNGTYFTNSSTTIPGITYSASVSNTGYEPHHAFDGLYYWNSGYWKTGSFYDVSSGLYNGSNSTTGIVGLGTVLGDWIQLDISSSSVVVQEYYVSVDLSSNAIKLPQKVTRNGGSIPAVWVVLGSNNGGTTWNVLDSFDWYNSDGVAGNDGVSGGYTFVIRNLFNNTASYKRYRLIVKRIFAYPGQTGSSMPGSILEWDLMVANPATYQVSRFARPIPTPSGLILFSNGAYRGASGQQLMLVTLGDLSGGIVDYTYNVPGFIGPVTSVLNGLTGIMTGVAFDGYRFAVGDVCGNVVYLANMEGAGYGMQWQNKLNGNVLVSGLSSIYDACSIDGRMCFGGITGSGGSPIMYTTMESGDAVFKPSNNASNIFASVTGLCSNEGKGAVYIPNYVWVDRSELFRVMGPRWYDYSAETISLSIECIPNTSLAYPL